MKKILIAILLLATIPAIQAYEENIREGIFLVRPENEYMVERALPTYLEQEDLTFFACLESEDTPIRLSVVCLDNNLFEDIQAIRWGPENCYMGSTNLEQFDCEQAVIQAEYEAGDENLVLEQEIRINRFSHTLERILQTQFEDGGWQTPLDTAHGLLVLSTYPDLFAERISQALEYLKVNRDENQKCWPGDECRLSTTANILFLLEESGFEDLRIQHDGNIYLENNQYYLSGEDWTLEIEDFPANTNNTLNTSCVYDYDGNINTTTLPRSPELTEINLLPEHYNNISVVCTEPVIVELKNEYEETLLTYQGDNFTYEIPPPCWTKNDENVNCDLRATLFASSLELSSSRISAAKTYLNTQVNVDRLAGSYVSDNNSHNVIHDALYMLAGGSDSSDVQTNILYRQSNNGSWQINSTYYQYGTFEMGRDEYLELKSAADDPITRYFTSTGLVVMALLNEDFERDEEVILDAERWVSINEDETGINLSDEDLQDADIAEEYADNISMILNDTKRNAMAHFVLKNNARPILLSEPKIVRPGSTPVSVDIINPTVFELEDLEYELSDSLEGLVDVEEKDFIGAYSFRRISISVKDNNEDSEIGYLRILKSGNEYLKLPIIVNDVPQLNISLPARINAFGSTAILPFSISKSSHNFTCSIEWATEGLSSSSIFDINNATEVYEYPVRFSEITTENKIYEGQVTCRAEQTTYQIPIASNIVRFPTKPLQLSPAILTFETPGEQDVQVTNRLDQAIEVSLALQSPDPLIVLENTELTLFPGEAQNVSIQVVADNQNYTATNRLVATSYDTEESILIDISLTPIVEQETPWWILAAIAGTLIIVLGGAGYYAYTRKEDLLKWYQEKFQKEDIEEKVTTKVEDLEREEELVAIKNMISILKLRGADETEVNKKLKEEGYSQQDIADAISYQEEQETPEEESNEKTK